jgi:hypothetical protein
MMPTGPDKEGQSGMQRLVDKVINEFQQNCELLQITALDGNGGKNGAVVFGCEGEVSRGCESSDT